VIHYHARGGDEKRFDEVCQTRSGAIGILRRNVRLTFTQGFVLETLGHYEFDGGAWVELEECEKIECGRME
jgi:hypothetical protein